MSALSRFSQAQARGVPPANASMLLRALLSMEADEARETAARARVARDTRPAPDGWDTLENVR